MKLVRITKLEFITLATFSGFKTIKYKDQPEQIIINLDQIVSVHHSNISEECIVLHMSNGEVIHTWAIELKDYLISFTM